MRFEETVKKRRSVRKYLKRPIPGSVLKKILDMARRAPSSLDGQPWHFLVITSPATKEELARIKNRYCPFDKQEFGADFIVGAPAVVAVCVHKKRSYDRGIESAVLATGHLLLAATDRGLSGVYMSAYKTGEPAVSEDIRALLKIPKHLDPVTLIPLGYPATGPARKKLRPLRRMITYDTRRKK